MDEKHDYPPPPADIQSHRRRRVGCLVMISAAVLIAILLLLLALATIPAALDGRSKLEGLSSIDRRVLLVIGALLAAALVLFMNGFRRWRH